MLQKYLTISVNACSLLPFIPPLFKVFYTVPPTLMQPPPALIHSTKLLGLKKYQSFISSKVAFYQNSVLNLLNPFTNSLS